MRVRTKICDVRDLATAVSCAEAGCDFVGVHCIEGIKPERSSELLRISTELPVRFPHVGVVAVTLLSEISAILEVLRELHPTHLQLHAAVWSPSRIQTLRSEIQAAGIAAPSIIGVRSIAGAGRGDIARYCDACDFVLFDRTHYDKTSPPRARIRPSAYRKYTALAAQSGTPAFIAGGINPENVTQYICAADPWGVDVQTGVETGFRKGDKDLAKVARLIELCRERLKPEGAHT